MRYFAKIAVSALVVLAASTSVAMADRVCDELWFTRNWVMHQAGYCFASPLGRAQFDNSDCSRQAIDLTPEQSAFVTEIRRREATFGCSVNTKRSTLEMPDLELRKRLERQPLPHEGDNMDGWGCLGYVGPEAALRAAPDATSAEVGRIASGDWVGVDGYQAVEGWLYVVAYGPSWETFRSGGWIPMGQAIRCELEAG